MVAENLYTEGSDYWSASRKYTANGNAWLKAPQGIIKTWRRVVYHHFGGRNVVNKKNSSNNKSTTEVMPMLNSESMSISKCTIWRQLKVLEFNRCATLMQPIKEAYALICLEHKDCTQEQ